MGTTHNRDFQKVKSSEIYHFGSLDILQASGQGQNQYFTQTYNFIIEPELQQQFLHYLKQKNNSCRSLVQIHDIQIEKRTTCSNSSKILVSFEYLPTTLKHLIDKSHIFGEPEVIRIFGCLLRAVDHLNQNDSYHGDICPEFIYVDTNYYSYEYKIFDSAYFNSIRNGYYRAQNEKAYSAPEILVNLGEQRAFPIYNYNVPDTFSIGLVLLYCMTGVDPLGAYTNKHEIDFYYIQSMLRMAVRKGFSNDLVSAIRQCLVQKNRPYANQLLVKYHGMLSQKNILKPSSKFSLKKSRYESLFADVKTTNYSQSRH